MTNLNFAVEKFISGKTINLRDAEIEDAQFILNLRTDAKKAKHLNSTNADIEAQKEYLRKYKTLKNEWYFIIETKKGEPLGTIRIYDVRGDDFCWGSWIIKDGAPFDVSIESVLLIYEYAFYKIGFNKVHFDVRKDNKTVRRFHEHFGAKQNSEDELNVFYTFNKNDYENIKLSYQHFIA